MQIEAGKYYRNRTGNKIGPMSKREHAAYPWIGNDRYGDGASFTNSGRYNTSVAEHNFDLVAEWQDEPAAALSNPVIARNSERSMRDFNEARRLADNPPAGTILLDWSATASAEYAPLAAILQEAYDQAASGKGRERHANDRAFIDQPILEIGRMCGPGFDTGQSIKKQQEAMGMLSRGEDDAAIRELLGAINYAAAAVILIRERKRA